MTTRRDACFRVASKVYGYLDGEIRSIRRVRIRIHLRQCMSCEQVYRFEERLRRLIRDRASMQAPPELVERLQRLIRDRR